MHLQLIGALLGVEKLAIALELQPRPAVGIGNELP